MKNALLVLDPGWAEGMSINGVAHLSEVRWAVLETNGTISFVKNSG